jgi:transposase
VITSVQRRRRWSSEEKRRIVAAAIEPGAVASEVARAAGIHVSQLSRYDPHLIVARPATAPLNPAQNLYPHQPTLRLALKPHPSSGTVTEQGGLPRRDTFFRSVRRRKMMQRIYLHHTALGNRVGLHYRRFGPKLKTRPVANQILAAQKISKSAFSGANPRTRANTAAYSAFAPVSLTISPQRS